MNKFYDIHFHAMDLSHANITAFTDRFINNPEAIKELLDEDLPWWKKAMVSLVMPVVGPFVSNRFLARKITSQLGRLQNIRNLLSFMETSVMFDFLIIEYFLKCDHMGEKRLVAADNTFSVGGQTYGKMVICPLVMDFGYPHLRNHDLYYSIPPQKPVVNQISDLFQAIYTYYHKELSLTTENKVVKFDVKDTSLHKNDRLFEIYPFMGINTVNYSPEKIAAMLQKYFGDFRMEDSADERYERLNAAMGEFNGNLDDTEKCRNIFAGIKLYPPLGFDPWPVDSAEKKKVEMLYEFCISKNIPVITHCSTGGFVASPDHARLTNPGGAWAAVLNDSRFSKLKIDFAHLGVDDPQWTKDILTMATDTERNVYTDISSICDHPGYYKILKETLAEYNPAVNDKVLFGTDFMINLLQVKSYSQYLNYYFNTSELSDHQKTRFASGNPHGFLFGM